MVFLIGFMGAGKTTLGKQLAGKLSYRFVDLDELIVAKAGRSIPEIFQDQGEPGFRRLEQTILKSLSGSDAVISCGGGAPCFEDNMLWMNKNGLTIFIEVPVDILYGRLKQLQEGRPMIAQKSPEELRNYIEDLLEQRRTCYQQAKYTVRHPVSAGDLAELIQAEGLKNNEI